MSKRDERGVKQLDYRGMKQASIMRLSLIRMTYLPFWMLALKR